MELYLKQTLTILFAGKDATARYVGERLQDLSSGDMVEIKLLYKDAAMIVAYKKENKQGQTPSRRFYPIQDFDDIVLKDKQLTNDPIEISHEGLGIVVFGNDKQITLWDIDIWENEPEYVFHIVQAVEFGLKYGARAFAYLYDKHWNAKTQTWDERRA